MTTSTLNGQNTPATFIAKAMAEATARSMDHSIPGVTPGWGQYPVPHVLSFQSIFGSLAKVYRPTDEAIKNSLDNARFMRNDCGIMECVEARQRAVALLDWHLEPEDEKCHHQKKLCADLTRILRRMKRFTDYRYNLLHALWYGRYAIQHQYNEVRIGGKYVTMPYPRWDDFDGTGWLPVNGDKLVFRYDDGRYLQSGGKAYPGQVGIRVGGQWKPTDKINDRWEVEYTDRGMAYFLDRNDRKLLAIHKHMIEDGAFEAGIDAGMIHGVGIRSRIYWDWFQKQEALAFLMEYLERSAGGIELWYYDEGNPESKRKTEEAATQRIGNKRNVILVPRPRGEDAMAYGVQVIEPGMAGIEALKDILTNYFGHRIKRYILGQVLTSEAESTGLGSGVADAHLDTLMMIIRYDAMGLDETITDQLVRWIKEWNFPEFRDVHIRYKTETEAPDLEKKLDGWQRAYEMGCRLKERDVMDLIGAEMPGPQDRALQHPQFTQQPGMPGQGGMPGDPSGGPGGGGPGNNGPTGPGGGLHPTTVALAMKASEETARALFGDVSNPDADTGERVKEKEQYAKTVDEAAAETDRNPSDEQKASGNYRKGKFRLHGLSIAIETPKGADRRGKNRAGEQWSVTLPVHYGYIHRTEGRDGDHVDCFIGPNPESEIVYVVDQTTSGGRFDEHKALIGFTTSEQAAAAYLGSYADDASKRIREVTPMTIDQFKAWLESGDLQRPVADQVSRYARLKSAAGQKSLWKEEDHPRNGSGEFTEKGTGSTHSDSSEKPAPAETEPAEKVDPSVMTAAEREKYDEYLALAKSFKLTARSESDWLKTFREQQERTKPKEKEPEQEQTEAETEPTKGTEPESAEVTSDGSEEDSVPDHEPEPAPTPQSLFSEATAEGESPREAADRAARVDDPDYEFARQSSIRNAGEDLKGSARHKVNAWRGLAEAEADGTAAEMVTRDNLMKAEPHGLMDHVGKNPLTAMAMHLALKKLPPVPGYGNERRRSLETEESRKKDREQFFQVYRGMKDKAEELARTEADPNKALDKLRQHVQDTIRSLRQRDPGNNTANAMIGMQKTIGGGLWYSRKQNTVGFQMKEFEKGIAQKYGDVSPDEKQERIVEHASDVIEGATVGNSFGQSSGRTRGKTFNTAEMYVTHAIREGGPDLSRETSDPAKATSLMVDRFGMRGVQWGNSVTDEERKHHAKMAAEALADLTEILGIEPSDVSLGGKLGLAIGARGHGTARAHYEPGTKVINLTRKSGVGSLAHEWGHAFDHSLSGFKQFESKQYHGQKNEGDIPKAFGHLKKSWNGSGYQNRLRETMDRMEKDGLRLPGGRAYWESPEEMFARSFERYIQHKLSTSGRANTYLAGLGENAYKTGGLWPNESEISAMTPHFDAIFDAYRKSRGGTGEPKKYSRDELIRYFLQEIERYEMTPAELQKAREESSETAPSKRSRGGKGGKWLKIGGGAPAFVSPDGTIKKGCPGLKGENVDDLIDEPEESRERRDARQAHAESKGLKGHQVTASEAKKWEGQGARRQHDAAKQAADRHGVAVADVIKALPEAHQFLLNEWQRVEGARSEARRRSGLNSSNLGKIENAYRDHSTVKNWDHFAEEFASELPEMGFGRTGDVEQEVWDFIREGSKPKPQLHSEETADMAAQLVGRKGSAVPSGWGDDGDNWESDSGDDSFDPDKFARRVIAAVERYASKKSAEGQQEFRWVTIGGSAGDEGQHEGGTPVKIEKATGKIVGGPKALADKGIQKLSDFGGKKVEEESGTTGAGKSRKWKKNEDGTYTAPNGTVWKKAAAGGEESPVNGNRYAGGHLMPIHGLSEAQKPKAVPNKTTNSDSQVKPNEHAKPKAPRELSEREIVEEKQRREDQRKWSEMSAGPLGRMKWLGESPNHRALSDSRINLKDWASFANEIGPEATSELANRLKSLAHERIDQATADARKKSLSGFPIPDDAEQWQKNQICVRAKEDASIQGMKKHVKINPNSLIARQLIQELLDNDNNPSGKSSLENMHDVNRMLLEASKKNDKPDETGPKRMKPQSGATKPSVPGTQSSLFGGDDLKTGQKSLFNVVRPEKGSKKPPADLLAGVSAELKEILARKETISPADIAGTSKQAESIEGQKGLFAMVRNSVERYLKRSSI